MNPVETTVMPSERYEDTHLTIHFSQGSVRLDGVFVPLPRKEFDLLTFLVRHAGELVPRESLLLAVWGYGAQIRTRTLDVHIRRLRQNLGRFGKVYIETIFGVGYRFQPCPASRVETPAVMAMGAHSGSGAWRWQESLN